MSARSDPVRVLLVVTSSLGGAGVQACQLARGLARDGFDITVAFGPGHPQDRDFDELGVPVERLRLSRGLDPITNALGIAQVRRMMRARRFDVLLTSCSVAGFVGRVAAALTPRAERPTSVHILQVYASRPYQLAPRRVLLRAVERGLDRLTTRYVAVSEAMKRFGVESDIFAPGKAEVIFNAAELSAPPPGSRERVRRELGIDPAAPVVGTLGRYEPQKGLADFLRAAAWVLERRSDARFLVLGDGPLRGELEALARRLGITGAVRFTGWRRDVPDVLGALDVFALASLWEPFGIVLVEAMLTGLPVVATAVDGIPEVVVERETGFLVPPQRPEVLGERLLEAIEDPPLRERMGRAGRERARDLFSCERMVAAYARLLRGLSSSRPTSGSRAS
jgi:glycosyltransferase involved in cell wall biosynthesis